MNGGTGARAKAKAALIRSFAGAANLKGYVDWPQANLVSGVRLEQLFAIHSSAALAVNCFSPFKNRPYPVAPGFYARIGQEIRRHFTMPQPRLTKPESIPCHPPP
jgi:hypothetical protein